MTDVKLSIAEIIEIAKAAKEQGIDSGLPRSKPGVADRAKQKNWAFETVPARGGKNGVKKVYTLPRETIAELERKGLSHLLKTGNDAPVTVAPKTAQPIQPTQPVPDFMRSMVAEYDTWAEEQSSNAIVPVRYHVNVFGSAGSGYTLSDELETQAMWFRASFFEYLETSPKYCFCTRVRGDSMYPTLIDRGTVLWKMQNTYTREGIYLFRQVNELRIKRLQRVNSHTFRIISDNKDMYPIEILDLRDMEEHEFEIYGRYLWDCAIRP